ncbi:UDP-glycosyltransferase 74G1 [Medicago truncatula]|uniref:Glycosyltransferase n=1 Tax=Medicago truncatula TaxID=3880 RepID=A2Q5W6_MEDTR|nr:UDP-glycosyltransferase 74G1 [Medicago truncatula]ABN08986.1 UDP-glucuronosyl/UDP-glucosyltransferase [Medicago truncatula]AES80468.1 UDP-glucosyltransferase family protein [Medicago truncatula]
MEKKVITNKVHCLVLPYPAQGHINPMLQFSKDLQHEGIRVTLVTTLYHRKTLQSVPPSFTIETISDGFDNGGVEEAGGYKAYLGRFWQVGPKTLAQLIEKFGSLGDKVDCVIYDSFFPWALDVAKRFGIVGVTYLTQNMSVNSIYYHVHLEKLKVPLIEDVISLPLLPRLDLGDMSSFFSTKGENPVLLDLLVGQFSNIDKADWVLCNTFYELEKEVVDWTMKIWPKFRPIGPSIPSMFLDNRHKDDEDYGVAQFKYNEKCMEWLNDKPKGSVVYVSFGSMVSLDEEQIQELAYGLRDSGSYFLWVVRASEENKLPKDFEKESKKSLVVTWCSQLKVLAHEAIGCFVTHCGWNSTLEALSLGVPTIAIPQWSDQRTNAKFIADVWKMGIRAPIDEKQIVRQDKFKDCILEIMKGEKGKEIKSNATQWKTLAVGAFEEHGSSQKNIIEFVTSLINVGPLTREGSIQ